MLKDENNVTIGPQLVGLGDAKMAGINNNIKGGVFLAGPWIGEFGHELFSWQAPLRQLSKSAKKTIVLCRKGREYLYEDFPSKIISIEVSTEDCVNEWCKKISQKTRSLIDEIYKSTPHDAEAQRRMPTKRIGNAGDYIKFGKPREDLQYDFAVHARNIYKTPNRGEYADFDMQRNWSWANWRDLLDRHKDKKIACIGSEKSAFYFDGCDNYVNRSLDQVADILFNSKLIIGPSSGPMHLAALSNCPVVTWSNHNVQWRYERTWNPFGINVYYFEQEPARFTKNKNPIYDAPSVDEIDGLLRGALENEK